MKRRRDIDWDKVKYNAWSVGVLSIVILVFGWVFSASMIPNMNSKKRKNVVVGKDGDTLFVRDIHDNKERTYVYDPCNRNWFNFVESSDTLILEIPMDVYIKKYKFGNNVISFEHGNNWKRNTAKCFDYNNVIAGRIAEHERIKEENNREAIAKQERIQELARQECAKQAAVTDSLRNALDGLGRMGRISTENNILQNGDNRQKKALEIIKAEEHTQYVIDSTWHAQELAEQQRIKQAIKHECETNKIIKQHKKNGTLWQYVAEQNVTLVDTARILRVYTDRRLDVGGSADYSSNYVYNSEHGGVGGLIVGGFGIGGGKSGESHFNSGANVFSQVDASYEEKSSVVAEDWYGYTYTFCVNPMLQLKCGDRIVFEYTGRRQADFGYLDQVKILNIFYQR